MSCPRCSSILAVNRSYDALVSYVSPADLPEITELVRILVGQRVFDEGGEYCAGCIADIAAGKGS